LDAARRGFGRFVTSPWLHVSWAVITAVALPATYPVDPYVFGITTLALCWVTAVLSPIGIIAALAARSRPWPARLAILVSALLSAALVGGALRMLRSFSWT
jgi:hypothetical protein